MNPFGVVTNRGQQQSRIALFTLGIAFIAVTILRAQFSSLDQLLWHFGSIEGDVAGLEVSISLGTLALAFAAALLDRIFELHDKVARLVGIRQRFDINEILVPMASGVGVHLSCCKVELLRRKRRDLMYETFYPYVSDDPSRSAIDTHYVHQAHDKWAWYWIFFNATIILAIVAFILFLGGKLSTAVPVIGACLVLSVFVVLLRRACARRAQDEVNQILANEGRKQQVKKVLDAL